MDYSERATWDDADVVPDVVAECAGLPAACEHASNVGEASVTAMRKSLEPDLRMKIV